MVAGQWVIMVIQCTYGITTICQLTEDHPTITPDVLSLLGDILSPSRHNNTLNQCWFNNGLPLVNVKPTLIQRLVSAGLVHVAYSDPTNT